MSDTREEQIEAAQPAPEWRCPKCGAQADERWDCCEVHAETERFNPAKDSPATADQMAAVMLLKGTPEQQAEVLAAIEKRLPGAIRHVAESVFKPGIREGLELAAAWHDSAAAMTNVRVIREFHEWSAQELRKLDTP